MVEVTRSESTALRARGYRVKWGLVDEQGAGIPDGWWACAADVDLLKVELALEKEEKR